MSDQKRYVAGTDPGLGNQVTVGVFIDGKHVDLSPESLEATRIHLSPHIPHPYTRDKQPIGPNVLRLTTLFATRNVHSLGDGLDVIANIEDRTREALAMVELALYAVKTAPDNPFGDNDEQIAGMIIAKFNEANRQHGIG